MPDAAPLGVKQMGGTVSDQLFPRILPAAMQAEDKDSREVVDHNRNGTVIKDGDEKVLDGSSVLAHGKGKIARTDNDRIVGSGGCSLLGQLDGETGRTTSKGTVVKPVSSSAWRADKMTIVRSSSDM